MKAIVLGLSYAIVFLCLGCHIQVGSGPGFHQSNLSQEHGAKKKGPKRELTESDVVGVNPADQINETDIRVALEKSHDFRLKKNSSIMLIQSGASTPEQIMIKELGRHFQVIPFSGLPLGEEVGTSPASDPGAASKALRLEAAQSGADSIVSYWLTQEIAKVDLPTKIVSWIPVLDIIVPDEAQDFRLRLKFALMDVKTGHWAIFRAPPYEAKGSDTAYARAHSDHSQLNSIKKKAYEQAVAQIVASYAGP